MSIAAGTCRQAGALAHHVVEVNEGVVDGNDVGLAVSDGGTEDDATDTAETAVMRTA